MNKRWLLAGLTATAATFPALADVRLTENLAFSGYVTGAAYTSKFDGSDRESGMEVDSAKLAFTGTFEKVTGVVSLHTFADTEIKLLDAYATYDFGGGSSLTMGKFLSYLGFEAFDYPNMLQISYANALSGLIPAYHSGVRFDFSNEGGFSGGIAVLDSVYGPDAYRGDQDLDNGVGMEAFLKYGTDTLTAFFALAYDASGPDDQLTADFWVQKVIGDTTLAAEFVHSSIDAPGGSVDANFWLLLAMQKFGNWSVTGRISGGEDDIFAPGARFTKYTVSPAVTLTDNLGLLFEYSHTEFKNTGFDDASYLAGQFVFKF